MSADSGETKSPSAACSESVDAAMLRREHPILFSAPMIRALLADRKFVTRRLEKRWLKVKAGDRLWVRENFRLETLLEDIPVGTLTNSKDPVKYCADEFVRGVPIDDFGRLRVGRFMPRWASRILLECEEDARVERLQDITEEEAYAEGVTDGWPLDDLPYLSGHGGRAVLNNFAHLWHTLHTKPGERWEDNPEVVRVGRFRRVESAQ
jgi:hypothetical protein